MLRTIVTALFIVLTGISAAVAQARDVWIQVEARPTRDEALERIFVYRTLFPMIGGFELANGWYAVAVGPFTDDESTGLLDQFVNAGLIPRDSYVTGADRFAGQFYPPRAASTEPPVEITPEADLPVVEVVTTAPEPAPEPDTETVDQARASEALLGRGEKMELQKALAWAGHYTGAIDGLYGRGTRAAMSSYQTANGLEDTGVLTTLQRTALMAAYNAILNGLDLGPVRNPEAGISVEMPRAVVTFDGEEAPFVHYRSDGDSPAAVHLISMPGDRNTLYALMEVMQSLEVVPLDSDVRRNRNNFVITGGNDSIVSHTEAYLDGGQIKGFTLVWTAAHREQFDRLVERMQLSFTTTNSVLPRGRSATLRPGQDMLAGLQVRQPAITQSGVFINGNGQVLTSAEIGDTCGAINVMGELDYRLEARSEALGLSLLSPLSDVTPLGHATLRSFPNRVGADVAVAGFAYGGQLGAPTLTFGAIASDIGLSGEEHLDRLGLRPFPSDRGAAVFGNTGDMVGLLQGASAPTGQQLPGDVAFMTDNLAIKQFLSDNGAAYSVHNGMLPIDALAQERLARETAVWVTCWE